MTFEQELQTVFEAQGFIVIGSQARQKMGAVISGERLTHAHESEAPELVRMVVVGKSTQDECIKQLKYLKPGRRVDYWPYFYRVIAE